MTRAVPRRIEYAWRVRGAIELFGCSLIAALSACGGKVQTEDSANAASCTYDDRQYPAGSGFSPDSCNTCNCTRAGEVFCTHRTCVAPVDAAAGGNQSYVDASASGGSSGTLACVGYALDMTAIDASEAKACLSTFLPVMSDAGADVSCSWDVPIPNAGQVIDPNKMQLLYLPDAGGPRALPRADSVDGCIGEIGGWHFDNPSHPLIISLCPCTCAQTNSGQFLLIAGCDMHFPIY